jgi:hypothetical protein
MKTLKKKVVKYNKTLKKKLTKYFCETKDKDICCESNYNREMIVEEIIAMYKKMFIGYADEYLEWIDNDILFFVGIRVDLEKAKNKEGVKMWDYISAKTMKKKLSDVTIRTLLMELPLYYLLAFLGNTYLKFKSYST